MKPATAHSRLRALAAGACAALLLALSTAAPAQDPAPAAVPAVTTPAETPAEGPAVTTSVGPAEAATTAAPAELPAAAGDAAAPAADGSPVDAAATPAEPPGQTFQGLDTEVQDLKKEVLDLNRDLFVLEEELLFPANTQVAVFLSMDVGTYFAIDSVQIRLDDKEVTNYLYTEREADALNRGGVQRVFLGNLKVGRHEIVAFFTGQGPHERDYRRGATITFEKGVGAKYIELRISDRQRRLQPEFVIKEWE